MSRAESGHPAAEQISAFLAGDLSERDGAATREHTDGCAACARVADELRRQVDLVAALSSERPEPPLTTWAAIEGALDRESQGRRGAAAWSWRSWMVGATCGAAVVLTLALVARRGWTGAGGREKSGATSGFEEAHAPAEGVVLQDPLLTEAEDELGRAATAYEQAAARLRRILEREQQRWDPVQRARVAERLAGLDEAVAHSRAVARRDPGDGAGAELLFAAYQKQIDFLAEAVHRGSPSLDEESR